MKYVGHYQPGQEVEVDEEMAKNLCAVKEVWDGEKLVVTQNAMTIGEYEKMKEESTKVENLTQSEALELGIKNITSTEKKDEVKEVKKGKK